MFEELDDETVAERLCVQAAELAAGECAHVLLVAEWDRRGVWAAQGCRSAAHWLNWRVGTSLWAAREQVRVGRALRDLPKITEAFRAGEISYSKVRAVTRIATPAIDGLLVEWARSATASQLETIVREQRRATGVAETEAAQARHARRYLRSYTDDDGMVVIRARLSPEDGAVVMAAIEAAHQAVDSAGPGADVSAGTLELTAGRAATGGGHSDATGVSAETLSGTREARSDASSDVSAETSEWAEVFYDGPLHAGESKAADGLVDVCRQVLATGVDDGHGRRPAVGVLVHVDQAVLADPASAGCCHVDGVGAIAAHSARRLACDAAVATLLYRPDGAVEPRGATRTIPGSMRRAILARDRHCRFPGCSTRCHLHVHHVVHWASGGPTTLSNLVILCGAHHRFVHEGGWRLSLTASGSVTARSPHGQTLTGRPPAAPAVHPGALGASHRRQGLHVGADTIKYGGEPYDLDLAITVLQQATGHI
jgi:hypothetical protein